MVLVSIEASTLIIMAKNVRIPSILNLCYLFGRFCVVQIIKEPLGPPPIYRKYDAESIDTCFARLKVLATERQEILEESTRLHSGNAEALMLDTEVADALARIE